MSEQKLSSTNYLATTGTFDPLASTTLIELSPDRVVSVATELLLGGSRVEESRLSAGGEVLAEAQAFTMIPVITEELVVTKRVVPLETMRVVKTSEPFLETAEVDLTQERWEITNVPCDTEVQDRHAMRMEGETSIYPVFEERLVARKALFLIEEVHVRRVLETRRETVEAELQRDVVTVERHVS